MEKLIIKESEWYRGLGSHKSFLLNNEGKMCCLGFYSITCGIEKEGILNKADPYSTRTISFSGTRSRPEYPRWVWLVNGVHSEAIEELININDDAFITDDYRKEKIKEIFAANDVEVEFVP